MSKEIEKRKVRVGIIGATGQVGESLLKVLAGHPHAEIVALTSDHAPNQPVTGLLPVLAGEPGLEGQTTVTTDAGALGRDCDVIFCAKKGEDSMRFAPEVLAGGAKFIDIGGEFRFRDADVYEKWYGRKHLCPELLEEAVYGLPELFREEIRSARLVGNPGCYSTAALVPTSVFFRAGIAASDNPVIVDAYSGLSGAGRRYSAKSRNLFVDVTENLRAYAVAAHRHQPEIAAQLGRAAGGKELSLLFSPHLAPLEKGILATIYIRPVEEISTAGALERLHEAFDSEPFVRVNDDFSSVETKNTRGTNFVDVSAVFDEGSGFLVLFSALDNTVKGAAGTAVQNMNLVMGLPETAGLLNRTI